MSVLKVKIASNAGFCFGVKRAMTMAWHELEKNEDTIYSLGPLIHNNQAVQKYEEKGLKTISAIDDVGHKSNIIIRSHGVSEEIYNKAKENDINIMDATCPFVKKIHEIANRYYKDGYKIIIIGDSKHPEVIGINGWCNNEAIIIKTLEDLKVVNLDNNQKYCVVAQTTINVNLYDKIVDEMSKQLKNIVLHNTICSATKVRQEAAKELSKEVEAMVVIGGKHSSNTQKLVQICEENAPTFAIETKEDLSVNDLKKYDYIGITAGASTPNWIIEDVVNYLQNI
jgi:4-hydroxy-3-methylbut-2-en-1-yl diphosphate reductase